LQHLYVTPKIRGEIFQLIENMIPEKVDRGNGRPGMDLWKIFVLGVLRLGLNCDYDRLQELANNHKTLRAMLGHGEDNGDCYQLQTVKDNIGLLTPELLDEISQIAVKAGHHLVKKEGILKGRCDSFFLETNVHYPTDITLLFDAVRKAVTLMARECQKQGVSGWRQSPHNIRRVKYHYRKVQKLKRSTSKDPVKKIKRELLVIEAHRVYLDVSSSILAKTVAALIELASHKTSTSALVEIRRYVAHGHRQIDQIERRVIHGEMIPHQEKVFSVFEEHSEWICKGKAGVPVELDIRVCILEDQYGFILGHQVMQKQTDDGVAVSMVEAWQKRFPELRQCSFDKGFYSPSNSERLSAMLNLSALPKKGKLSRQERELESSEEYIDAKRKHSAVESAINALEVHGMEKCFDRGIAGFKRYAALAVVGRNIHQLGALQIKKELKSESRKKRRKKAA